MSQPASESAVVSAPVVQSEAPRKRKTRALPELSTLRSSNCPAIARALVKSASHRHIRPLRALGISLLHQRTRGLIYSLLSPLCAVCATVSVLQLSSNGEWVTDCLHTLGMENETDLQRVQSELTRILRRRNHSHTPRSAGWHALCRLHPLAHRCCCAVGPRADSVGLPPIESQPALPASAPAHDRAVGAVHAQSAECCTPHRSCRR